MRHPRPRLPDADHHRVQARRSDSRSGDDRRGWLRCADPDAAYRGNALGTQNVALACQPLAVPYFTSARTKSFDGTKTEPYLEFDAPNPINAYGRSKLAGEMFVRDLLTQFYIVASRGCMAKAEITLSARSSAAPTNKAVCASSPMKSARPRTRQTSPALCASLSIRARSACIIW